VTQPPNGENLASEYCSVYYLINICHFTHLQGLIVFELGSTNPMTTEDLLVRRSYGPKFPLSQACRQFQQVKTRRESSPIQAENRIDLPMFS
jgi:hypothetical protein